MWNTWAIGNLLRNMCAKNCYNRYSFVKAIAKKTVQFFASHGITLVVFMTSCIAVEVIFTTDNYDK